MKKTVKRVFSFLLCLLLCAALLPAPSAYAADSGTYDGMIWEASGGKVTITGYTGTLPADLAIPATIDGKPVTSIGEDAFWGCSGLTSVTIPASVTSIGKNSFDVCSRLTAITVASGNPNYSSDNKGVLFNKSKTELIRAPNAISGSYEIPAGVTSIGEGAFEDCVCLTSVTIPVSVTSIGGNGTPFTFCAALTAITVASGNPNFSSDSRGVLFNKNKSILIEAPGKLSGSYTIPASVTSIGRNAFVGCSGLTSVTIPASVTSIGNYAFNGCHGLTSVTISEGMTSIGENAFEYCSGLTSVTIPASVTSIGDWAFDGCSELTAITVASGNQNYSSDSRGVLFNKSKTDLIKAPGGISGSYTIPAGVTSISDWAFENCSSLTSVTIPAGVTSIGENAFEECAALTSVTIPASVTSIGTEAFYLCSSLTSVTIPAGVTSIGESAFSYCSSLTSVTIPAGVTSIGEKTFNNCSSMTSLTISKGVTSIGEEAFYGCSSLTSVTIPASVTSIGGWAFCHCDSLSEIRFSHGEDAPLTLGCYSFHVDSDLATSVYIIDPANINAAVSGYDWAGSNRSVTYKNLVIAPTITVQPQSVTKTAGESASFTVKATGATSYQWQTYVASSGKWANITSSDYSGVKTSTMTVPATAARNGAKYRCLVINSAGYVASANVTLTVQSKPTITTQPQSVTVPVGQTASFTVKATGATSYQWQTYIASSGKWSNIGSADYSGVKTATMSVPVTAARNGAKYRCLVINSAGYVASMSVTLTVQSKPTITAQPQSVTRTVGETAYFAVEAGGTSLSYQWQTYLASSGKWANITSSDYSGVKTASMAVPVTAARNGAKYRCLVINSAGYVVSANVTLTVVSKPTIMAQPQDAFVHVGETASFTVKADGSGLSYQWQVYVKSSEAWSNIGGADYSGVKTATMTVPLTAARNGAKYRCVVKNAYGTVTSSAAALRVSGKPLITSQPQSVTKAAGETASFTVAASGTSLTYQWQVYIKSSGAWSNITSSDYSGVKTATMSVPATAARNGAQFRCVVKNSLGTVNSASATLTVG